MSYIKSVCFSILFSLRWTLSERTMNTEKPQLRTFFQTNNEPFLYLANSTDGTTSIRGYGNDVVDWAVKYANLRYNISGYISFEEFANEFVAQEMSPSSNYTQGKIGYFNTTDVDLLVFAYGIIDGVVKLGEFTAVDNLIFSMIIPYPEEKMKLWAFVYPFTTTVWICTLVSALCVGGCATIFNRLTRTSGRFQSPFFYLFQVIIGQGGSVSSSKNYFRILAAAWCIASLILSNVYLSLLVSFFSTPYRVPVAQNLKEVLENDIAPVLTKNAFEEMLFQESPEGTIYRKLYERSVNGASCTFENFTSTCVDYLIEKHYAALFIAHGDGEHYFGPLYVSQNCTVTAIDLEDGPISYGGIYMMPKGHPYHKDVALAMLRVDEYGVRGQMRHHAQGPRSGKCPCCNWKKDRPALSKLGTKDLVSIFAVLGVGYALAFLVFLLELILGRKRSRM